MPAELDDVIHFLWQELEEGDDARLAEAVANLHVAIGGNELEPFDGLVSDLRKGEVAGLEREGEVDPETATGVLLVDRVGCDVPGLERVVAHPEQDELYVGVYDAYERTMTRSGPDYLEGRSDWLSWDLVYETSALGAGYTVDSQTLMRRVPDAFEGEPAVLIRAHLLKPAVFDNPDTNQFLEQDYHLEIYWPHDDALNHVYALWKDTRLLGFEDEAEATQRITLNKLSDWDEGTSQLCAEGLP